jgi:hypothetical protein
MKVTEVMPSTPIPQYINEPLPQQPQQQYFDPQPIAPVLPQEMVADLAPNINPGQEIIAGQDLMGEAMGMIQKPIEFELTPERKKLLNSLSAYRYSRFYNRIVEIFPNIFEDLSKRPDSELVKDLELIKSYIKQRRSCDQFQKQFQNVLIACDSVAQFIGWEVEGASDILIRDEEVLDQLEEVRLKFEIDVGPEPEVLLATSVLAVYLKVNAKNQLEKRLKSEKVKNGIKETLDKPAPENLEKEYKDI